ncbi:S9 family peptidase [Halorussus amylolyticus]|uniref:S9 family peptidase n=1 Tax=Halorussus amylolyticus TaxID=1126242 RepID=UPI0010463892|nr:prolyl oligopeptidase family serine peptidase [Halorussus amylolyticus]
MTASSADEFSIADVLDVEYPGAPEWSADGRFVAATVYEDDGNALLVADADGTDSWRISASRDAEMRERDGLRTDTRTPEGHVTGFEWGPESRPADLLVTTDAGETFRANPDDRTLRLVARSPAGESNHEWSPSGDRVAFYREGRVRVRDPDSGTERELDVPANDAFLPTGRMLAWADDATLAFSFTDRETRQVGVADADSGDLLWRTEGTDSSSNPAFLGDGRLVFERIADGRTVRSILVADLDSGATTELLREDDEKGVVSGGAPTVSPAGDRLAIALPLDGWDHVYLLDPDSGERRQLTSGEFEDKGLAGSSPQWADDDTLLVASNRRDLGQRHIFAIDTETGEETPVVTSQGTNVHPKPSPSGDRVAYVHADRDRSAEVRVQSLGDGPDAAASGPSDTDSAPTRLTESGVEEWPVEPIPPKHVTFESFGVDGRSPSARETESRGGTEISGYLVDPRDTDAVADDAENLPSVVWVHGGPMRQMRDGWHPGRSYSLPYAFHQYLARKGYVGLLVNYRGGIGYGKAFRQAISGAYGRDEMADVVAAAEFLRDRAFTSESVGLWGLSYGGYAALQILGTHPDAFDVGVNLAGLADLELYGEWAHETKFPAVESSREAFLGGTKWEAADEWAAATPKNHFENYEAPLYNFHGTGDSYVNFEQLDAVIDGMLEHGNEYEAEYYPGENHVFSKRATWERTFRKIERAFCDHLR